MPIYYFDFDDTLFPTSWLISWVKDLTHPIELSEAVKAALAQYSKILYELISYCTTHGRMIIVTNAEARWVQEMMERYLPQISLTDVVVYSAADYIREKLPDTPYQRWKLVMFRQLLPNNPEESIYCAGDCSNDLDCFWEAVLETKIRYHAMHAARFMEHPLLFQLKRSLLQLLVDLKNPPSTHHYVEYRYHWDPTASNKDQQSLPIT